MVYCADYSEIAFYSMQGIDMSKCQIYKMEEKEVPEWTPQNSDKYYFINNELKLEDKQFSSEGPISQGHLKTGNIFPYTDKGELQGLKTIKKLEELFSNWKILIEEYKLVKTRYGCPSYGEFFKDVDGKIKQFNQTTKNNSLSSNNYDIFLIKEEKVKWIPNQNEIFEFFNFTEGELISPKTKQRAFNTSIAIKIKNCFKPGSAPVEEVKKIFNGE